MRYDGDTRAFEGEVQRVAEAVFGLSPGSCQGTHYKNNPIVAELDGIARTREATHLIMVTTSTKLEKVKSDIKKLNAAEQIEKPHSIAVRKWLITSKQLEAEHIDIARKSNVTALTLDQFRRLFFDGKRYLDLRLHASFGSARDPITNSTSIGEDVYIPLPIVVHDIGGMAPNRRGEPTRYAVGDHIDLDDIEYLISIGTTVVLVAPFGAGKSLTTREIFKRLSKRYRSGKATVVPIALNLREHWGQDDSAEVLERHARLIGYPQRADVVAAWRSSMAHLLLDGFDELASQAIIRTDDKSFMREARREALTGVRDVLGSAPGGVGVLVCGRDHYFDNESELRSALGISGKPHIVLKLEEFDETGAQRFLSQNGIFAPLPDWLPRKPLILAYLLQNALFDEILAIPTGEFGYAWDSFLTRIAERESLLARSVMEAHTVRSVMERLAFSVRAKSSGIGPVTGVDLADAYAAETGQGAGEGVLAQLQRLPGLAQREQDPSARSFIDDDMLSALQGSAFARLILGAYTYKGATPLHALPPKAISMAAYMLGTTEAKPETVIAAAERLSRQATVDRSLEQSVGDAALVAMALAAETDRDELDFRGLTITGADIAEVDLEDMVLHNLNLRNCTIHQVSLGAAASLSNIRFSGCLIDCVLGVASRANLPTGMFDDQCDIEGYETFATSAALQQLQAPPQLKALLTALRKLYKQAGGGRKRAAFHRGITQQEVARYIDPVLALLERSGFVTISNNVVHPVRKQASRVQRILDAPTLSQDPIVQDAQAL
jgi:hypothetical protein